MSSIINAINLKKYTISSVDNNLSSELILLSFRKLQLKSLPMEVR